MNPQLIRLFILSILITISISTQVKVDVKDSSIIYPTWPQTFITNWTIIYTPNETEPPFPGSFPAPPFQGGRGITYYDYPSQSMTEIYHDFCVPIFANGSNWSCQFINIKGVSYLLSDDPRTYMPPCCIFTTGDVPTPNFIQSSGAVQNVTSTLNCEQVDYWTLYLEDSGAFGYGFYAGGSPSTGWTPASFYFAAAPVGWAIQNFYNFQPDATIDYIWEIPSQCVNAGQCPP